MRLRALLPLLLSFCFLVSLFVPTQSNSANKEERIVVKNPVIANPVMPRVLFNHDKHVAFVDANGSDCSRCHTMTSQGFSVAVFHVGLQKKDKQVSYIHASCSGCHKTSGRGPQLVECKSCHVQNATVADSSK